VPSDNHHYFKGLKSDPELKMAAVLILVLPVLFFVRHWIAAIEVNEGENVIAALRALWGTAFEVMSFLSTTGFESAFWGDVRAWSGIETTGIALMAIAIMGGGVATTAGGIKLLRVYALYKHGAREMQRLVHPSSVGGAGADARLIRRDGAIVAWMFFMLSALSLAAIMLAFALSGLDFEAAMIFASACLSTTGPLVAVAGETPLAFSDLSSAGKIVGIVAMILGRLETLVIIALLNPAIWRS
jgi:trk system potassium uptake protein TrkH